MIKVSFDKNQLIEAVQPALCAVTERNTVVAMGGILFECKETECVMSTYDMEKGLQQTVACVVTEGAGSSFVINAGKLSRIIRTMPGENINIDIDENYQCKIHSGNAVFDLKALPGSDFPHMPYLQGQNTIHVPKNLLKKLIIEVQFAIAANDQRITLNGAFFEIRKGSIKLVSCDGNKVAVRECVCDTADLACEDGSTVLKFIVPGKTLAELLRLLGDGEEIIEIATTYRHIFFFLENMTFFSRMIDGEYIDYTRFVRAESPITVYASRAAFLSASERASLITEERTVGQAKSSLKCNFEGNVLHVFADNINGSVHEDIAIEKTGDDLFIAFNCRYLIDALRACPEDSLKISLTSGSWSMQIEGTNADGSDKFLFIVLPVKLS